MIVANGLLILDKELVSLINCQNEIPNLRQVFLREVKASRDFLPFSLLVEPLIFLRFTYSLISLSAPLLCKGISGHLSTKSNSFLLATSFLSACSRATQSVLV